MASREENIDIARNYYPDRSVPMTHAYMKMRFAARELADALTAAEEELDRLREESYKISVCYFPSKQEVEATWEDADGNVVFVTFPIDAETGNCLAEIVSCCVYHRAILRNTTETEGSDE